METVKIIQRVSLQKAKEIIDTREPKGLFFAREDGSCIGIDNTSGEAWTEDFPSLKECLEWLLEGAE